MSTPPGEKKKLTVLHDADYRERFVQHLLSQKKEDGRQVTGVQE